MSSTTNVSKAQNSQGISPQARRAIRASMIGTLIEWYDYALYGAAAGLVISHLFFPDFLSTAGTLAAFATFAVGFVIRPIGGVVIAHIGDQYGRKPAMILTIALMGFATVGIGLLPTAESIGLWAPVLLVVFRCIQGFGAGAELAGAFTMVAEYTPPEKRGFYTGLINATPAAGTLLATLAFLAVSTLPTEVLFGWAWRVPFLASSILFFVALYIRNRLEETPEYVKVVAKQAATMSKHKIPLAQLLTKSGRRVISGFLAITGLNANLYILTAFSIAYLTGDIGMSRTEALMAVVISAAFGIVGAPISGLLTDRFGPRKVLVFGGLFGAIFAFPLFMAMQSGNFGLVVTAMSVANAITLSASLGSQGAFLTNLFPTRYRFSGVALTRELNGALIAGTTPLIAAALIAAANGGIWMAATYLAVCSLCTVVGIWVARGEGNIQAIENAPQQKYAGAPESSAIK